MEPKSHPSQDFENVLAYSQAYSGEFLHDVYGVSLYMYSIPNTVLPGYMVRGFVHRKLTI